MFVFAEDFPASDIGENMITFAEYDAVLQVYRGDGKLEAEVSVT